MSSESARGLADQVVLVTGAGSGMGRAIATRYAARGAHVVAADVASTGLDTLQAELRGTSGAFTPVMADVATPDGASRMIETAIKTFGRLDILVNSAGILDRMLLVGETPIEIWDRVLAVNLTGPFMLCRLAVPIMLEQGSGVIVNIASSAGIRGGRAGAAYTASKHGLIGLGRSLGVAYKDQGLRCVTVVPSSMGHGFGSEPRESRSEAGSAMNSKTRATLPARRGTPDDIADLVLFLASDAARHITASEILIDGGNTAH